MCRIISVAKITGQKYKNVAQRSSFSSKIMGDPGKVKPSVYTCVVLGHLLPELTLFCVKDFVDCSSVPCILLSLVVDAASSSQDKRWMFVFCNVIFFQYLPRFDVFMTSITVLKIQRTNASKGCSFIGCGSNLLSR